MVSMSSFSRSKPVRGRVSSGHPTSSQGINHECAPAHGPHHGPHPSPKSAHAPPGHPFKCMLQDHSDAHEDEEAANGAELGTPSEPPHPRPCITRGHAESAQQRPRAAEQCAARPRAKDDEHVPEELASAGSRETNDRRGHPRAVEGWWPLPGWLSEGEAADERRDVVIYAHTGGHQHAVAHGK